MDKEIILKKLLKIKREFVENKKECNYVLYLCPMFSFSEEFFNFDIVTQICKELHIKKPVRTIVFPKKFNGIGWWDRDDYKTRLAVINKLIKMYS